MTKIFINELKSGDQVESSFLVFSASKAETKTGKPYLNLEIGDKTGRLNAKVWSEAKEGEDLKFQDLMHILAKGQVAQVTGRTSQFNGNLQLTITDARWLEAESINWADFTKT
ncbi:MAG: OB-fold nucleic acid binding domain-containing protein, partial [Candidatus Adiutrix sp.]